MEYMKGIDGLYIQEETAVTLGKFDGVHRGHQKLLSRILEKKNLKSVMFTINGRKSGFVLTDEEKRFMLEKTGLSYLIDCPFIPSVSGMEAEDFVREILVNRLHAKSIVVGKDFHFGYKRGGDASLLLWLQKKYGFQVEVVEKEQYKGRDISSTYVKEALEAGDMELVNDLLGYRYFISGEVLHGRRIGRTLGMPTTNLVPSTKKLLPPNGVYLSRTRIGEQAYYGVTNIGYKPTIGETFRGVETYLFDFDGDLYGENIDVELWKFKRPEMKFDSVEHLKNQMQADIAFGKEYFFEKIVSGCLANLMMLLGVIFIFLGFLCRRYRNIHAKYKGRAEATVVEIVAGHPDEKGRQEGVHNYFYPVFAYYADGVLIRKRYRYGSNPCKICAESKK